MNEEHMYRAVQLDVDGGVVTEEQVVAASYNSALKNVKRLAPETFRIVIFDHEGDKAGEACAAYWHNSVRR